MTRVSPLGRALAAATAAAVAIVAGAGTASAAMSVTLVLPANVRSVYIYQGPGPEGDSTWNDCYYSSGGPSGSSTVLGGLPASPGQQQWNFYAYADVDCPITSDGPIGIAKNQTAPNSGTWRVTLR